MGGDHPDLDTAKPPMRGDHQDFDTVTPSDIVNSSVAHKTVVRQLSETVRVGRALIKQLYTSCRFVFKADVSILS